MFAVLRIHLRMVGRKAVPRSVLFLPDGQIGQFVGIDVHDIAEIIVIEHVDDGDDVFPQKNGIGLVPRRIIGKLGKPGVGDAIDKIKHLLI